MRKLAWITITALALLGLIPPTTAGAGDHPEKIPVRKYDWDELARQPGGEQLLEQARKRQGEGARRWAVVHDMLGEHLVSRKSHELLRQRGLGPALLASQVQAQDKARSGGGRFALPTAAGIDTLEVLLIRISFEDNRRPDLTTVAAGCTPADSV